MKLIEALEILRQPVADASPEFRVFLACGFEPLHLRTFVAAHLCQLNPGKRVKVETGLFGDLCGNIERLDSASADALVVVLEWGDLDSRLAVRSLGGWRPADVTDAAEYADRTAARLERSILQIAGRLPTIVCQPALPLPPLFSAPPDQAAATELSLRRMIASLAETLSSHPGIRIVNSQLLDENSPPARRYDLKSDVSTGFPYSLQHASAAGELIAGLIHNRPPKKGLITDLDDTLWFGILGDEGVEGVSWTLNNGSHLHGLYQQFLASLASAGVLIGVASKNDRATVDLAFERQDLLISKKDIFPIEAHWSGKSKSVERILATWNVSADAVVFIDDSQMEAAEVKASFPQMECIVFPKDDYSALWNLLRHLRGVFGKSIITGDDALRLNSIRDSVAWRDASQSSAGVSDDFLKAADACITFDFAQAGDDVRAFELVNKTNQFNLNGKRFSEQQWKGYFANPAAFLLTASYKDKFGALGKVAVLVGTTHGRKVSLDSWVLSCRAFSRRIEYQCLRHLFDALDADEATFHYEATSRNTPLQQFLRDLFRDEPVPDCAITRERFAASAPALFHRVEGAVHV
jgi:FkbH-like protein